MRNLQVKVISPLFGKEEKSEAFYEDRYYGAFSLVTNSNDGRGRDLLIHKHFQQ